jgi:hypothetical protein
MIPKVDEHTIDYHLQQALAHLERALNESVNAVQQNESSQKEIAQKWEGFLGKFFGSVREKGKLYRINVLGWISFPRIGKW